MLPSLRLIIATSLVGFIAVFAGLRMTAMTRLAHDTTLTGLATAAVAAPVVFAHVPAAPVRPASPMARALVIDPPPREFVVPVMFNLDAVIAATRPAPESLTENAAASSPPPKLRLAYARAADPPHHSQLRTKGGEPRDSTDFEADSDTAAVLPEITPAPAELRPLTILPETAWRSIAEITLVPHELPRLTLLLPGITLQPAGDAKPVFAELSATGRPEIALRSVPELAPVPAEPPPLPALPEIALQSLPEPIPVAIVEAIAIKSPEPGHAMSEASPGADVTLAELASNTLAPAAIGARVPAPTDVGPTGAAKPLDLASMDASNRIVEPPPVTVLVRLPVAKPPLQIKARVKAKPKVKTTRAKRKAIVRQAVAQDQFRMIFANPRHRFDQPAAWSNKDRSTGVNGPTH